MKKWALLYSIALQALLMATTGYGFYYRQKPAFQTTSRGQPTRPVFTQEPTRTTRLQSGPLNQPGAMQSRQFSGYFGNIFSKQTYAQFSQPVPEKIRNLFAQITQKALTGALTVEDIQQIPKSYLNTPVPEESNTTFLKSIIAHTAFYPQELQIKFVETLLDKGARLDVGVGNVQMDDPSYEGSPLAIAIKHLNVGAVKALIDQDRWQYESRNAAPYSILT
jgi:hypothetical protein